MRHEQQRQRVAARPQGLQHNTHAPLDSLLPVAPPHIYIHSQHTLTPSPCLPAAITPHMHVSPHPHPHPHTITPTHSPLLPVEAPDVLDHLVVPCMVAMRHVEAGNVHAVVGKHGQDLRASAMACARTCAWACACARHEQCRGTAVFKVQGPPGKGKGAAK